MSLNIVYTPAGYAAYKKYAGQDDVVILVGSGVYAASEDIEHSVVGLADDFKAAGLSAPSGLELITYEQFVELTVQHHPAVNWHD